jgi:hypothetical protein
VGANVKGAAITARLRFVRERHGEEGLGRLLATLRDDQRAALEGRVLSQAWVPYDLFVDFGEAADRLFGKGDLALCHEMGRYAAEVNLPTIYRLFYRLGNTQYILRKAAQLWSVHYDSGHLAVSDEGPGTARLEIVGFDRPHRVHCLSVLGWAVRSIELSGGAILEAEEVACRTRGDETCVIVARWS